MKKIITVTLCIVLVLLFAGCGKNGDTSKVEIDYGASSVYSKEEIDSAIEIIKNQCFTWAGIMLVGAVLSYFLTPYMAIPAFIIWFVLFFKEVHFDTHKAFEKYLLK